jgi:hypothetical protein
MDVIRSNLKRPLGQIRRLAGLLRGCLVRGDVSDQIEANAFRVCFQLSTNSVSQNW